MASPLSGFVKSWNGAKGYGFLGSDSLQGDVMFHRKSLPEDSREVSGKFMEGRPVTFEVEQGADGRTSASSVLLAYVEGKPVPGQIKSYSDRNGYGFISSTTLGQDVHFGSKDLPVQATRDVLRDKLVTFDVVAAEDGKLRVGTLRFQSNKIATEVQGSAGIMGAMGGMMSAMGGMKGKQGFQGSAVSNGGQSNGVVKSFSERNGYGFINTPGQAGDIKFGKEDVAGGRIAPGTSVTFTTNVLPDGRLVAKNVSPGSGGMKRPASAMGGGNDMASMMQAMMSMMGANMGRPPKQQRSGPAPTETATGQYKTGVVQSFNGQKGFGFISSPGLPKDVFFMKTALPFELKDCHGNDISGKSVRFELAYTEDGKARAQNMTMA